MRKYFYGKYYKFVAQNGYAFAIIHAHSNEGESFQFITPTKAYTSIPVSQIALSNDEHTFIFNITCDDISVKGALNIGKLNPLKRKVMGPFSYLPLMECKHEIYSMYHEINGQLIINNQCVDFNNGFGYIEGDKGINFPSKYIWYNSVLKDVGVTLAIATIPYGPINFTGLLGFIKTRYKEYYLSTYNFAKIKKKCDNEIIIKKRHYKLCIKISQINGHDLKAPVNGDMNRYIKENISIPSSYKLYYKNKLILSNDDKNSSIEWMY